MASGVRGSELWRRKHTERLGDTVYGVTPPDGNSSSARPSPSMSTTQRSWLTEQHTSCNHEPRIYASELRHSAFQAEHMPPTTATLPPLCNSHSRPSRFTGHLSPSPCRVLGPLTRHAVHLLLRRCARLPGAGRDAVHTLTRVAVVQPGVAAVLTRLAQLGTLLQRTARLRGGRGDELRCTGCGGLTLLEARR